MISQCNENIQMCLMLGLCHYLLLHSQALISLLQVPHLVNDFELAGFCCTPILQNLWTWGQQSNVLMFIYKKQWKSSAIGKKNLNDIMLTASCMRHLELSMYGFTQLTITFCFYKMRFKTNYKLNVLLWLLGQNAAIFFVKYDLIY